MGRLLCHASPVSARLLYSDLELPEVSPHLMPRLTGLVLRKSDEENRQPTEDHMRPDPVLSRERARVAVTTRLWVVTTQGGLKNPLPLEPTISDAPPNCTTPTPEERRAETMLDRNTDVDPSCAAAGYRRSTSGTTPSARRHRVSPALGTASIPSSSLPLYASGRTLSGGR